MADDTRQTLDIPNGTTFEFKDGKLIFGHESDIVIRTNMGGYKFKKIFSKRGSVQVLPPPGVEFEVDEIEALEGDIFVNGFVRAQATRANTIHFHDGRLTADRLEAKKEVVLSGGKLDVLHVRAPLVTIDPEAQGTCLVIESKNDVGTFRARGGFRSLEEAQSAFERFTRLTRGESAAPAPAPAAAPASASMAGAPSLALPPAAGPRTSATFPGQAAPVSAGANPAIQRSSALAMAETQSGPLTDSDEGEEVASETQEIRPSSLPRSFDGATSTPSLPKSSVFRKRK